MLSLPRKIERELVVSLAHVQVESDPWIFLVDAGTRSAVLSKCIDDCIFGALHPVVRGKLAVRSLGATNRKRLTRSKVLPPRNVAERVIESRVVVPIEFDDWKQNARRDARPQTQAISLTQGAPGKDHGRAHVD
jgi:hypothetical protein